MLGDLGTDIIGTNPQLPKIVDHSWLDVDLTKYDNFPSDNNPVRVVPKLNELWNHAATQQPGINLIPNSTVMPLGTRSSNEDENAVVQIVREAKKAAMMGLKGKDLSKHLRARFSSRHLEMAGESLKKVSEEIGLLGNVYIDASAFNSYDDAEQFLRQHRGRLAKIILLNSEVLSPNAVSMIASKFHKNVAASVDYDEKLLKQYREHLVSAGLPRDFVVDSKEALRQAFLYDKKASTAPVKENEPAKVLEKKEIEAGLIGMAEERQARNQEASDSVFVSKISSIVSFVQENLAKGKPAVFVKDMLRSRFVLDDIKVASQALSVALSKEGLTGQNIDKMIQEGVISNTIGNALKQIGKKFPVKQATVSDVSHREKTVGVPGFLYTPKVHNASDDLYHQASLKALKSGIELSKIRAKLLEKISASEADKVLSDVVALANMTPAGSVANKPAKASKNLVPDIKARETLPNPETIVPQTKEILSFFEGSEMPVDIDGPSAYKSLEINGLLNTEGIDQSL